MLWSREQVRCGIFDSAIQRKNKTKSPQRKVSSYELELFLEVGGESHVNGEVFPIRRGMLLCARPGDIRYSEFPARCRFLRLTPQEEDDPCQRLLRSLPTCLYLSDDKFRTLIPLFTKLGAALTAPGDGEDLDLLRTNSLLFEILCRVKGLLEEEKSAPLAISTAVRDAYEYINEHFELDCTLEELADAVHLTPNYLHTVFTRQVGKTPLALRDERRMQQALLLLSQGEKSIVQIALDIGFCSQSHFNRVFKKHFGMTPSRYRKEIFFEY